ncbi:uncharacterized protein DNG_07319 [Cephalotrichum gorgonifer]|uniref:Uncharacterized protein n=1 Tax=Cephalotrichum gorgonifer TaxID=2041049 RepID=A0AAE8SXD8_9PEZI|nr:uncharacterized protein DNG_07319 [Cephalotrichum gorgonifer]
MSVNHWAIEDGSSLGSLSLLLSAAAAGRWTAVRTLLRLGHSPEQKLFIRRYERRGGKTWSATVWMIYYAMLSMRLPNNSKARSRVEGISLPFVDIDKENHHLVLEELLDAGRVDPDCHLLLCRRHQDDEGKEQPQDDDGIDCNLCKPTHVVSLPDVFRAHTDYDKAPADEVYVPVLEEPRMARHSVHTPPDLKPDAIPKEYEQLGTVEDCVTLPFVLSLGPEHKDSVNDTDENRSLSARTHYGHHPYVYKTLEEKSGVRIFNDSGTELPLWHVSLANQLPTRYGETREDTREEFTGVAARTAAVLYTPHVHNTVGRADGSGKLGDVSYEANDGHVYSKSCDLPKKS